MITKRNMRVIRDLIADGKKNGYGYFPGVAEKLGMNDTVYKISVGIVNFRGCVTYPRS